jgi:hypothetical protein
MNPKCLGGKRHLPHVLNASRLRRERRRRLQELGAVAEGDRELKTREQNADEHGEHMFA